MRRAFLAACAGCALLATTGQALAQAAYPNKPIRLVVPFAAGGGNDAVARVLGEGLAKVLGQPVVVDNRAGAGGNIGTDFVAKSAPDGYTILHVSNSVVMNPSLYKKLPFDIQADLAPLGVVATTPILLLAHPSANIANLQQLLDALRSRGAQLSYATPGAGTPHHFAMELLASRVKPGVVHVPYKGAGPAVADAVGGQVPLLVSTPQSVTDFVASGRLRLLATMEPVRRPEFKDVPIVAEALPGFNVSIWHGIMAPAGTPRPVVDKLAGALQAVLGQPEVQARLRTIGFQANFQAPEAMAARIRDEIPMWKKVAAGAGISAE